MSFAIQKTLLLILLPPSGPLLLVLLGLLLSFAGLRKISRAFIITGIITLYLMSTSVVSGMLIRPLERDFRSLEKSFPRCDAIVILTAGVRDLSHLGLDAEPSPTTLVRLMHGIMIHREMPEVPLIISGGKGDPAKPGLSESRAAARFAEAAGVAARHIIVEDESFNTKRAAERILHILGPDRRTIILVTSAFHMGRSLRFFNNAGFTVISAPTDHRAVSEKLTLYSLIPTSGYLGTSSSAIYEYLSRARYALFE